MVFLQTIEHVERPEEVLRHFRSMLRPGGAAYVSTPNLLTLAPAGRRSRTTPGTCASTGSRSSGRCARRSSTSFELFGLFHARKLRAHELALRAGLGPGARGAAASPSPSTTASRPRSRAATSRCARADLERALDFVAVLHRTG